MPITRFAKDQVKRSRGQTDHASITTDHANTGLPVKVQVKRSRYRSCTDHGGTDHDLPPYIGGVGRVSATSEGWSKSPQNPIKPLALGSGTDFRRPNLHGPLMGSPGTTRWDHLPRGQPRHGASL